MIILKFDFPENFQAATRALGRERIPFLAQTAKEGWTPNLIWLAEEDLRGAPRQEALGQVRLIEKGDRLQNQRRNRRGLPASIHGAALAGEDALETLALF